MNELLRVLNALSADDLESLITRASIILEKKRKEEAEQALLEKERLRQERLAQERKRQEEIAELERKLNELKSQSAKEAEDPGVRGGNFVMYDKAQPAPGAVSETPRQAPVQSAARPAPPPEKITCPYCHKLNVADSLFCSNCGQKMTGSQPTPRPQSAAGTVSRPVAQPVSQPQRSAAQVRYANSSMKKWDRLPDERTLLADHEIVIYQPVRSGAYIYQMEVTNHRILISRQNVAVRGAGMTLGIVGSLLVGDAKPWLEIPLTAIKRCWVEQKNFIIEADQNYVLKNKKYEQLLPDLIASARR